MPPAARPWLASVRLAHWPVSPDGTFPVAAVVARALVSHLACYLLPPSHLSPGALRLPKVVACALPSREPLPSPSRVQAAQGRGEGFTETRDVVLLRQIESRMKQLQADGWSAFAEAMNDVAAKPRAWPRGKDGAAAVVMGYEAGQGDAAEEEGAAGA